METKRKGHKTHRKHVVKLWRGRPVKGRERKRPDDALRARGRLPADPELHGVPREETTATQVRSTWIERKAWDAAAALEGLTIGPWARRVLTREAERVNAASPPVADAE